MKPQVTLTQLEEEPETSFLGLTFTEIKGAFIKAFLVIILVTGIAALFVEFTTAPAIGMPVFFWLLVRKTSNNRADKPLYYQRHLKMYKNAKLIIQAAKYYQRERTNYESAKKQTKK